MANYLTLTLDTTAPASPTIDVGGTYTAAQLINAVIGTGDGTTTNYQMKLWGNVDTAFDVNVQATEAASAWITYATSKQIKLASGDGSKTVYVKIRDDVYNESAQASDSITLDSTKPIVSLTSDGITKVSKIAGKNVATFSFTSDTDYVEYKIKVVTSSSADESTGTLLGTTNGSSNVAGTGTFVGSTPKTVTVNGADLQAASAGDGAKIVKVFVKDASGNWSA